MKGLIPFGRKDKEELPSRMADSSAHALERRMSSLFDDFFDDFEGVFRGGPLLRREERWLAEEPRFEVSETDDEFRVKAELPGMDEKDIEVDLEGDELTIRGEKKHEKEEKRRDYHVTEVSYGEFSRMFTLPEGVDREKAKAQFKKGVLTLTLPKTEQVRAQRKHIEVSAA